MSRAHDLTAEAMAGWNGERDACPYLWSSPAWYAYQAGHFMCWRGMPEPSDVRMGRGDKVRVRDMVMQVTWNKALKRSRIERIA